MINIYCRVAWSLALSERERLAWTDRETQVLAWTLLIVVAENAHFCHSPRTGHIYSYIFLIALVSSVTTTAMPKFPNGDCHSFIRSNWNRKILCLVPNLVSGNLIWAFYSSDFVRKVNFRLKNYEALKIFIKTNILKSCELKILSESFWFSLNIDLYLLFIMKTSLLFKLLIGLHMVSLSNTRFFIATYHCPGPIYFYYL